MIYINGRFLTRQMTGVERFAYKICKALAQAGQTFTVVCPPAPIQPCYDVSNLQIITYGHGSSHFWEQCVLPFFFLGKKNYVLFSFTGLGSILVRHKVMTIHDLSFLENPSWFSKAYYWWYRLTTPLAVLTSRHIITVSEFSRQEILRFYPYLKPERISVVYGAADTELFRRLSSTETENTDGEERFALTVSSLDPRKNFAQLIRAFQGIPDCRLYIVGVRHRVFNDKGKEGVVSVNADSPENENVKFLGRVSDSELVRLYNRAACFIFPSVYEGFGLPPLEAMNCGCPVLASDIPVLREVCGDAAVYFNPHDVGDIHHIILQYLSEGAEKAETLRSKGFTNSGRFSWDASARAIMRIASKISP
ncbi:MAG: glycosyltransferase family 4 protein [Prevotella sp.]|nr:glycosyltransferase family 4 protein [Prevotella sp.]